MAWVGLLALLSCGGDDDVAAGDGAIADGISMADSNAEVVEKLFAREHLLEVEIQLDADDWTMLREQTRTISSVLGGDCLAKPFETPFTYFPAKVTIDGVTVENAGLRKKGFLGSLSESKPSLKINFNEFVMGQKFLGLDKLTLNNSQQDPSVIRQCLAYDFFAKAGVIAPRCNFARVSVNGESYGLYVHIEAPDDDFVENRFADDSGNLYEGTLSDFREDFVGTFDLKTNVMANDRSDLNALVDALQVADADLEDALDPLVDLDQFYTFWAAEVLTKHWDGYASNTNNFYVYHHPENGRFSFIPWGVDGTFSPNPLTEEQPPTSVFASGVLARRLYLYAPTRLAYLQRLGEMLANDWNETELLADIANMESIITLVADPNHSLGLAEQIEVVRKVVSERRAEITAELDDGAPAWDLPLRDPLCLKDVGDLTMSFSTTWGTIGAENPFDTGTGMIDMTIFGQTLDVTTVGATSGDDPDMSNGPRKQIAVVGLLEDGNLIAVVLQLEPSAFVAGDHAVDWGAVFGVVYHFDLQTEVADLVGILSEGSLSLTKAMTTDGQPVTGDVTSKIVDWPF